ncbi:hypothetical protein [Massilia sp. YMA4]|uniref:hypothetical protein n=1 Tax=Massilia sp. YMA4 TaxID=1593482 RepID=UPI0015843B81|nr:hypothetical protein [Massilia sp. YMA4]
MNLFGAGVAWALADDLVTPAAQGAIGWSALWGGAVLTVCQAALCLLRPGRLAHVLLLRAGIALSLVWFFVCAILPLWWMDEVDQPVQWFVLLSLAAAGGAGAVVGACRFQASWLGSGRAALARHYDRERGLLDWDALIRQLARRAGAGAPSLDRTRAAVIAAAIVFMLVAPGYVFGAAAAAVIVWGGLIAAGLGWSTALIGSTLAQAAALWRLERHDGVRLAPYPEEMPRERARQGQRRR